MAHRRGLGQAGRDLQPVPHKGGKVYIEGRLQTRSWEQDGQKRYKTEVVAYEMIMLDSRAGRRVERGRERGRRQGRREPLTVVAAVDDDSCPSKAPPGAAWRGRAAPFLAGLKQ